MKRLVFAPALINLAETTRMIEVAKVARDRFDIHFMGYGGRYEHYLEELGLPYQRLEPHWTQEREEHVLSLLMGKKMGNLFSTDDLHTRVTNELAVFDELAPEAVVMGHEWSTVLSTRAAGLPLVSVLPVTVTRWFFESGLGAWDETHGPTLARLIAAMLPTSVLNWLWVRSKMFLGSFNRVAKIVGARPLQSMWEIFQGDLNLLTDIPEFVGLTDPPPDHHFVGPIFANLDVPIPPEILEMPKDKPIIYFAMGSSGEPAMIKEIIEGFAGRDYRVIAPVAALTEQIAIEVPENVVVTGWIPAPKINPLADLSVLHGGQGTLQTALVAGTPIIGVAMQIEQSNNLEILVRQGVGVRIRKRDLCVERLLETIDLVLADDEMRERSREVQQLFQEWDGPRRASQFLEARFG